MKVPLWVPSSAVRVLLPVELFCDVCFICFAASSHSAHIMLFLLV